MEVDIGDPIYVQKEAEDCWCEGTFTVYFRLEYIDASFNATTIAY